MSVFSPHTAKTDCSMRANTGCCIFSLLHHILGVLLLALLFITATMATSPTLRRAKSGTSWSRSFFPPVKAPAMGFMAANGGMARRYWTTKGLGVGRRLLMWSDASTSGFSGAGSTANNEKRNAGSIQGPAEAGDEVFRTGLPPLHWPSPDAETVSGNRGADQSSAPAPTVNLGKNNKRKGAASLPPIKGALPNKSKSTGPPASNVNTGTGEGAYAGDVSRGSSSSREEISINAYPLHARAAVAVTIATKPSAFEKVGREGKGKTGPVGIWSLAFAFCLVWTHVTAVGYPRFWGHAPQRMCQRQTRSRFPVHPGLSHLIATL